MQQSLYDDLDIDSGNYSRLKKKLFIPTPVQLAPKHCNCDKCVWHGHKKPCEQKYVTMADMQAFYKKQSRITSAETIQTISRIQAFYSSIIKAKDEQLLFQHNEIMNLLPKETVSTRARREKKKLGICKTGSFKKKEKNKKIVSHTPPISPIHPQTPLPPPFSPILLLSPPHTPLISPPQVETSVASDSEWTEVKKKNKPRVQMDIEYNFVSNNFVSNNFVSNNFVSNNFVRNKMCKSVATNNPCSHGEKCRFAHNYDELVLSDCIFGTECKHVKRQSEGVYLLLEGKYCNHKHPGETKVSVCARFGIPICDAPKEEVPIDIKPKQLRSIVKESVKAIVSTTMPTEDDNDREVVIRVQKELAVQALEFVVKSGKNNIRVELV